MPVGHAVTATSLRRAPEDAAGAGLAAGAAAGAAAAAAAAGVEPTVIPRARCTSSTICSAVSASRSASVNAGFTSARASLVRSWRCVASPPAGAAIRNATSAGPSLAPNSTLGSSRANARVGSSTPVVRQWGMAMPPGSPVGDVASRARASSTSWSTLVARPASPTTWASARITSCLSEPRSASRRTSSVVMRSDMCQIPWVVRSRTETSAELTCEGWGMVVPGRPAAALP